MPFFRDRYTCVTFDHRGFGRSLDARPVAEQPGFDEELAALIDSLELPDVRLVAQSMGGWTCLRYAATHPERVRALVMADTPGGLTSFEELEAARADDAKRSGGLPLEIRALGEDFRGRDPYGAFLYEQIAGLNPPREQALDLNRYSVSVEQAASLKLPVLFIEGESDINVPPNVIRIAQQLIPGARLQMVADAGHSVYFERPDEFNRIVDAFLAEAGA